MKILSTSLLIVCVASLSAGHSRFPYFDGGQSANGRYRVTPQLIVKPGTRKKQSTYYWEYIWKDNKSGRTIRGRLQGLRSGRSSVFDPIHAHIFVAPGGETFAVWNPNVTAPTSPAKKKWPKLTSPQARTWEGFSHRLTVYRKTGEIVKRLDLKDFLLSRDWNWLFCYGKQVYWQSGYPPLNRDNAPRVGYALYRVSPDYTVLETRVGGTQEAARKAKERGVTPPPPRPVRINLITGQVLAPNRKITDPDQVPIRPFKGERIKKGGRGRMKDYIPGIDPLRIPGRFRP